jgi:hypothetical protein
METSGGRASVMAPVRIRFTGVAETLDLYEKFFPEDPLPDRSLVLPDEATTALGLQSL